MVNRYLTGTLRCGILGDPDGALIIITPEGVRNG